MRRRVFTAPTLLLLVPGLAAVVLWVLSYGHGCAYEFGRDDGQLWEVASRDGGLRLGNAPQRKLDSAPLQPYIDEERTQQAKFERLRMEKETPDVYDEV